MRLSASSLAGTARTLVAVGTVSEAFMFLTTAADAPRSGDCLPAATGIAGLAAAAGAAGFASPVLAGALLSAGLAGAGALGVAGFAAAAGAGDAGAGAAGAAAYAEPLSDATGSSRSPPPTGLPGR